MKTKLSRHWIAFLTLATFVGFILRFIYVQDMEYKEDEEYNFIQTQLIGVTQPWPWYGIASGVLLVNPGMSVWVFAILAKLFRIHEPTSLAHAVQIFALLGMSLVVPYALYFISDREKRTWLWAYALALVNPFLVLYQRKLWPEPFLPFFAMITLMGWSKRRTRLGAFIWGCFGACIGQVHMSGFFSAFALFLWTFFFDSQRKSPKLQIIEWRYWFLGSIVGSLPLIPWGIYALQHMPSGRGIGLGWEEISQFKFWAFWLTDPTGLHLGNALGVRLGNSNWVQIVDFLHYPYLWGKPTFLVGAIHFLTASCVLWIWGRGIRQLLKKSSTPLFARFIGRESETAFLLNSVCWGCGILLTLTGVVIRRYYMAVTFPFEFIFLIRCAQADTPWGKRLLTCLWICEALISAHFVGYIHVNEGAPQGDYGPAYHLLLPKK